MKTLSRIWPLLAGAIASIALAITPFVPLTRQLWELDKPAAFNAVLATAIGLYFIINSTMIGAMLVRDGGGVRDEMAKFVSRYPGSVIRWLRDDEFYSEFYAAAEGAVHTVRICYFAPTPPADGAPKGRLEYYRKLAALIKRERRAQYQRLIRYSDANRDWIAELLRDLEGEPNASIAVVDADLEPTKRMPLALSVQIVDENKSWLVAIKSHERQGAFRDLYVESKDFAEAMGLYYERLWSNATLVLENGRVTDEGVKLSQMPEEK